MITQNRLKLYENLDEKIGNTPLIKYEGNTPNENVIWMKKECDNPFGSHYDRVYKKLFRRYEDNSLVAPFGKVYETSSGTAAVSFASIGFELGYTCLVAIPQDTDDAIIDLLENLKCEIYFTPKEDYVNAFPDIVKKFMRRRRDYVYLNHSMGRTTEQNNEVALGALESIMREIQEEITVDIFMPAVGNGSTLLGPSRVLDSSSQVIPFESFQSAVLYDLLYPGKYKYNYGIDPGSLPKHGLRGTSFQGITFPHIHDAVSRKIVDDCILVTDSYVSKDYQLETNRELVGIPAWDRKLEIEDNYGKSTRAGIVSALEVAQRVNNKNIVIIQYDTDERYDWKI